MPTKTNGYIITWLPLLTEALHKGWNLTAVAEKEAMEAKLIAV